MVERLQGKGKQLATMTGGVEESWSLIGGDLVPTEESLEEFGLVQREFHSLIFLKPREEGVCSSSFLRRDGRGYAG